MALDIWANTETSEDLSDHISEFKTHWLAKDKDLTLVLVGSSIFGRSTLYAPVRTDATERPQGFHALDASSYIWDKLKWPEQTHESALHAGAFSETAGTWTTSKTHADWDDGAYREQDTRYSDDAAAAFSTVIPSDAYIFRLVVRTDGSGGPVAFSVAEGNGYLEYWNGSAWIEANGATASYAEPAPVTRSIDIPHPDTGVESTYTRASASNTNHQKRFKFRCADGGAFDSRGSTKTLTVTGTGAGRKTYVGREWSTIPYMVTLINSARGSWNCRAEATRGLPTVQDTEIWSHEPDLVLAEVLMNDGASTADVYAGNRWAQIVENYAFSDAELSLKTRAAHFGLNPEIVLMSGVLLQSSVNADGSLKAPVQDDSVPRTSIDKYQQGADYVAANYPGTGFIMNIDTYVAGGRAIFGNLYTALEPSNLHGPTMTGDGTHPNKLGAKVLRNGFIGLFAFGNS